MAGYTPGYKTVHTFASILNRKLYLKNGMEVFNSGSLIQVPFQHRDFFRLVEHQLSHILFKTDPEARQAFISTYATEVLDVAASAGEELDRSKLHHVVGSIVDILENHRVTSLWGKLFPGSYVLMRQMFFGEALKVMSQDHHESLLGFFLTLSYGVEPRSQNLDRYRPYFVEALNKVRSRGFDATLLVAKWLLTSLVSEVMRETRGEPAPQGGPDMNTEHEDALEQMAQQVGAQGGNGDPSSNSSESPQSTDGEQGDGENEGDGEGGNDQGQGGPQEGEGGDADGDDFWEPPQVRSGMQERLQALQDMLNQMGELPPTLKESLDDSRSNTYRKDYWKDKSKGMGQSIARTSVRNSAQMQQFMQASEEDTDSQLLLARSRMGEVKQVHRDTWLTKEAMAKVAFHDVGKSEVTGMPALDHEARKTIKHLQAVFMRVLGRRKFSLDETGSEIDISTWLERRSTGVPLDCFKHEESGQGFQALILVDLSQSMMGMKIAQAERACRILRRSMDFPFVRVEVWGFSSLYNGQCDIYRFDPKLQDVPVSEYVEGMTPLHVAVRLGSRHLQNSSADKHLIILTDGMPCFQNTKGMGYKTRALMKFIHDAVQKGRVRGVHTTTVAIGHQYNRSGAAPVIQYDIEVHDMRKMFGPRKCWRRVKPDDLGRNLVTLATDSFINYLRRK